MRNDGYKIAILGATSQIARDMIVTFANAGKHHLHLFARRTDEVRKWLAANSLLGRYVVGDFSEFSGQKFDGVINFVGVGNPAQAAKMGASILDITYEFDSLALNYVKNFPSCRYIFLSSGAAYGGSFSAPADENTISSFPINSLSQADWYGAAKMFAECRHRALPELAIVDVRVFNYFSRTQDMSARFLITDMLRAIREKTVLQVSSDYIVRDFIHPSDFTNLVEAILKAQPTNTVVDCYTRAPVDKPTLLSNMQKNFGLKYEYTDSLSVVNGTGIKSEYYSLNKRAALFGYEPEFDSMQGVMRETALYLECV